MRSRATIEAVLDEVTRLGSFFVRPPADLAREEAVEIELPWEIFHGHLLPPHQTRERRAFVAWNILYHENAGTPGARIVSLLLDEQARQVHVVRAIDSYVWEPYDAGGNTIETRETRQWLQELIGSVDLERMDVADALRDRLAFHVFQAAIGTSRLPVTSVESPHTLFTLGNLGYIFRPFGFGEEPARSFVDWIEHGRHPALARLQRIKWLETFIRATSMAELPRAAKLCEGDSDHWLSLLRGLFNEIALSPYTDFVDKTLAFVALLVERQAMTPEAEVDFLTHLLRQLARHLTAYDLVTFHHQGANYPDMLVIDAVLKRSFSLMESDSRLWLPEKSDSEVMAKQKRLRRRGLRMGWLLRRHYEGLLVPDAPTSPGENMRVLPPPFARVPADQITDPSKRTKRLFADDPLDRHLGPQSSLVLRQSIQDLREPLEMRELGMAIFLDRAEDGSLHSYTAFSPTIAHRRLRELIQDAQEQATLRQVLDSLPTFGLPALLPREGPCPGRLSICDAYRVAADFQIIERLCDYADRQ